MREQLPQLWLLLFALAVTGLNKAPAFGQSAADLSAGEIRTLENGVLIKKETWHDGYPWPELHFYKILNTDPIEAAAVFFDYERQEDYIPDMKVSEIVKTLSPTEHHVRFVNKVPWPLNKTHYTTGNRLEQKATDHFEINWYFIKADDFDDTQGGVIFKPYENGQTLMIYHNLVDPKSWVAGLFESRYIKDSKRVVDAIADWIDVKADIQRTYVQQRVAALKQALGQ